MELTHTFTVPSSPSDTWEHFGDIGAVAECFPGAAVTMAEGDDFEGTVKVKLGPISLVYTGTGHFVERDEAAKRFVIEAKGKDKRGNGTASATVTATMAEAGSGTEVSVVTDLAVTGKPAQFGRGVMQDVSDKLLGQFVDCLGQRVGAVTAGEPSAPPTEGAPLEGQAAEHEPPAPERPAAPPPKAAEELNLASTVLPVILKAYWRQALIGLAAIVILVIVIRWIIHRG